MIRKSHQTKLVNWIGHLSWGQSKKRKEVEVITVTASLCQWATLAKHPINHQGRQCVIRHWVIAVRSRVQVKTLYMLVKVKLRLGMQTGNSQPAKAGEENVDRKHSLPSRLADVLVADGASLSQQNPKYFTPHHRAQDLVRWVLLLVSASPLVENFNRSLCVKKHHIQCLQFALVV